MNFKDIAAHACRLHDQKLLSDEALIKILRDCVNGTAIANGYADTHGLPFPDDRQRPRRRRR